MKTNPYLRLASRGGARRLKGSKEKERESKLRKAEGK